MAFLAPLFLLGGAAIALPILFHLVRRTTRDIQPFPSLMFLQPTPPKRTQRSHVENWLLLLLRCLAILLLALAFGRPLWQKLNPGENPGAALTRTVLLVDGSASLHGTGAWPAALQRTEELLKAHAADEELAVAVWDRTARPLLGFDEWRTLASPEARTATALERLRALAPSAAGTHLGTALQWAEQWALSEAPAGRHLQVELIVLTDLQAGTHLDGLAGHAWREGVTVQLERLPAPEPANASLQWLPDGEERVGTTAERPVRIRVRNGEGAKTEQLKLTWASAPQAPTEVYVPAGQTRTLRLPLPKGAQTGDQLTLSGDALSFDNTLHILPPPPEPVRVVFPEAEATPQGRELLMFLRRAFPATSAQVVEIATPAAATPWPAGPTPRLAILPPGAGEQTVAQLRAAAEAGSYLLAPLTSAADATALSRLLAQPSVTAAEASAQNYALLSRIDFTHGLFAAFADPRFSDFTKIHFWKHRTLTLPAEAKVLATFDDGAPAIALQPVGQGAVVVLASSWLLADSQFALSTKFVPWLQSLLALARRESLPLPQYTVGDTLPVPAGLTKVTRPGASAPEPISGPLLATTPGLYRFEGGPTLAVNGDPAESQLAPLPEDQLAALALPTKAAAGAAQNADARAAIAATENRQKLWRWLAGAAVFFLLVETLLAGRLSRAGAAQPAPAA